MFGCDLEIWCLSVCLSCVGCVGVGDSFMRFAHVYLHTCCGRLCGSCIGRVCCPLSCPISWGFGRFREVGWWCTMAMCPAADRGGCVFLLARVGAQLQTPTLNMWLECGRTRLKVPDTRATLGEKQQMCEYVCVCVLCVNPFVVSQPQIEQVLVPFHYAHLSAVGQHICIYVTPV